MQTYYKGKIFYLSILCPHTSQYPSYISWIPLNKSLAYKPVDSIEEIMERVECYVRGKERNEVKIAKDVKEHNYRDLNPPINA